MSSLALALLDELRPSLEQLVKDAVVAAMNQKQRHYPEKVTVELASEITGYSKNSLYQMHSKGQVPGAVKIGGKLLFDTETLRNWVQGVSSPNAQTQI